MLPKITNANAIVPRIMNWIDIFILDKERSQTGIVQMIFHGLPKKQATSGIAVIKHLAIIAMAVILSQRAGMVALFVRRKVSKRSLKTKLSPKRLSFSRTSNA